MTPSTRSTGRTVTVAQVLVACIPILLIIFTPVLPFANRPGLVLGLPSMFVWMAGLVVAIVIMLQIIDRQITAREDALAAKSEDHLGDDMPKTGETGLPGGRGNGTAGPEE